MRDMVSIVMTKETLAKTIENCEQYIEESENDINQVRAYYHELVKVLSCETTKQSWGVLLHTGIFHDAIGKWEKIEGEVVYYETEY